MKSRYDPTKHHRRSIRLRGYDYASPGAYFVTMVTHDRECLFGNDIFRRVAEYNWRALSRHFPNVILDEWIVMPNHIHGIVIIDRVGTQDLAFLPRRPNKFGPQSRNLASIIRGFKIGVTKFANENDMPFAWQSRFHDRIIRNNDELNRIRKYIHENPINWETDRNNNQKHNG